MYKYRMGIGFCNTMYDSDLHVGVIVAVWVCVYVGVGGSILYVYMCM